ncbi:hypothetical protein [Longicatena caecimuris]|uniref:Transcription factor zinc-finger domain-containing protein n=1 Tax=Longicatena caecimuris TaxID=1796635 RepID=A0A4R3TBM4_9FIRM|nr:hypothetical protein [Longicatena caecimuris]MCR1870473.1 hypothetical protein [Longicatena caecimuris]MCU0103130.1 hypothetical protein [Longicatena caecimuris]RJV89283.1 hypothetical protein DWX13_00335 [Eubacterium sp. AF18-3]TCU58446.1 hypothetical protein EDD61_11370 [Longicatena caecimuris]
MVCPYCEQGNVVQVKIKRTGKKIYICDECDTIWLNGETISHFNGTGFEEYAKANGFQSIWTELELL